MKKKTEHELAHSIDQVERRIEVRRARLQRHAGEVADATREWAKPLPLLGAAAVAVVGFLLSRGRAAPPVRRYESVAWPGLIAALAGLAQIALRLAASPLIRAGWNRYVSRGRP